MENTNIMNTAKYKVSRGAYIAEATLEYLIALLCQSTFLATLTGSIGINDAQTGIIASISTLGCLFQLFSIFIRRGRMKKFVVVMSILNQFLFMMLYVIPFTPIPSAAKPIVFTLCIFLAYFIYNVTHPKKIAWLMSVVEDRNRGKFTAFKEMVSLIAGIVFPIVMGNIIDKYKAAGDLKTAFIICGVSIFVISVLHTVSMLICVEPEEREASSKKKSLFGEIVSTFKNKDVLLIAILFSIWHIANSSTVSFYGTFQKNDLGFSVATSMYLSSIGSIVRIFVSPVWGNYADKKGFAAMIQRCFIFAIFAFGSIIFATPKTGIICFALYYIFHSIALGGINSALINLIFSYVPHEKRADSLAISQATAGLIGFLGSLGFSGIISAVQAAGNRVFGIPMYAQQLLSILSVILTVVCIIFVSTVISKRDKK